MYAEFTLPGGEPVDSSKDWLPRNGVEGSGETKWTNYGLTGHWESHSLKVPFCPSDASAAPA